MVRPHRRAFTVIEGGKAELERKKRLLFNQPWAFDLDEFDRLCELFKLSRAEAFDLALTRVKHKAKTSYEAAALLAVGCPVAGLKKTSRRASPAGERSPAGAGGSGDVHPRPLVQRLIQRPLKTVT
jgi:hypothetical protein